MAAARPGEGTPGTPGGSTVPNEGRGSAVARFLVRV